MKAGFLPIALLLFAWAGIACQREARSGPDAGPGMVVAKVNGTPIYQRDYVHSVAHAERVFSRQHGEIAAEEKKRLRKRILTKMVDDELLVQHAAVEGLQVKDAEVARNLERLKHSGGGEAAFVLFLEQSGIEPHRVRANLKRNMILERLAERIRVSEEVGPQAINEYYQGHKDEFTSAGSVELAHILFKGDAAAEQARKVRKEILAGLSFEEAAKRYSRDPATREQGGMLGLMKKGEMLPDLEAAAFSLAQGRVSTPVKSRAGIHLLMVTKKNAGRIRPLDQVKTQVAEMIKDLRVERRMQELVSRLRQKARIESPAPARPD